MFAIILFISGVVMLLQNDSKVLKIVTPFENTIFAITCFLSVVVGVTSFVTLFFIKTGMQIKQAIASISICIFLKSLIAVMVLCIGVKTNIPNTLGYLYMPLLVSSVPFAIVGSLLAVKYLNIIPTILLKYSLIVLMFISSFIMFF